MILSAQRRSESTLALCDRFSATGRSIDGNLTLARVRAYEAEMAVLLPMVICAGYWASEAHVPILLRALKRIADDARDENGLVILLGLRRYPAMLATYAMGRIGRGWCR